MAIQLSNIDTAYGFLCPFTGVRVQKSPFFYWIFIFVVFFTEKIYLLLLLLKILMYTIIGTHGWTAGSSSMRARVKHRSVKNNGFYFFFSDNFFFSLRFKWRGRLRDVLFQNRIINRMRESCSNAHILLFSRFLFVVCPRESDRKMLHKNIMTPRVDITTCCTPSSSWEIKLIVRAKSLIPHEYHLCKNHVFIYI